jgi:hypothetical protein
MPPLILTCIAGVVAASIIVVAMAAATASIFFLSDIRRAPPATHAELLQR